MPKSTFRAAARRSNRAARHDPLARPSAAGTSSSEPTSSSAPSKGRSSLGSADASATPVPAALSKLPIPPGLSAENTKGKKAAAAATATGTAAGAGFAALGGIPPSDVIWALASVSLLSSSRASRKALLQPNHHLLPRILYILSLPFPTQSSSSSSSAASAIDTKTHAELKREAAGALRNLCIEAGFEDVRLEVGRIPGAVDMLVDTLDAAHHLLLSSPTASAAAGDAAPSGTAEMDADTPALTMQQQLDAEKERLQAALPTPEKPLEQMNRKERRHALKAAAILQKHRDAEKNGTPIELSAPDADESTTDATEEKTASGPSASLRTLASDTLSQHEEQRSMLLELQENLLTVLWCLIEASDSLLLAVTRRSSAVARIAVDCVRRSVSSSGAAAEKESSDERSFPLQLGMTAANLLCMLSDSNAPFVRVLAGAPPTTEEATVLRKQIKNVGAAPTGPAAAAAAAAAAAGGSEKARFQREMLKLELSLQGETSSNLGRSQLTALALAAAGSASDAALTTLPAWPLSTSATASKPAAQKKAEAEHLQRTTLAALSAATLRNTLACLPPTSRGSAQVLLSESGGAEKTSLLAFERTRILPQLLHLLQGVKHEEVWNAVLSAASQAKAGKSGEKPALAGPDSVVAALNARQMTGADAQMEEEEEAGASKGKNVADDMLQIILLSLEILAEALPTLSASSADDADGEVDDMMQDEEWMQNEDGEEDAMDDDVMQEDLEAVTAADHEDGGATGSSAAASNGASAHAFGNSILAKTFAEPILCNELVRLSQPAALGLAFPSSNETGAADSQKEAVDAASDALRQIQLRSVSALSNLLLALAARGPTPPSQPPQTDSQRAQIAAFSEWSRSAAVRPRFEALWSQLFAIALRVAEVPAVAENGSSSEGEGADGRALVEHCVGSMWAIARCMEGELPLQPAADAPPVVNALQAAYLSALGDGMRAKTIGALGCLARARDVTVETNRSIGDFLIGVVKNIPADGKAKAQHDTSAESMVAALNAVYDVYADENAAYDEPVFRRGGYLQAIRQASGKVRAMVSFLLELLFAHRDPVAESSRHLFSPRLARWTGGALQACDRRQTRRTRTCSHL